MNKVIFSHRNGAYMAVGDVWHHGLVNGLYHGE